jgi:hypothetical protein
MVKTQHEARLERLTIGAVLLVLAVVEFGLLPAPLRGLDVLLIGLVLVASAALQQARRWPVGRLTWLVGLLVLAVGLLEATVTLPGASAVALAVLLVGLWLVGRGFGLEG